MTRGRHPKYKHTPNPSSDASDSKHFKMQLGGNYVVISDWFGEIHHTKRRCPALFADGRVDVYQDSEFKIKNMYDGLVPGKWYDDIWLILDKM